MTVDFLLSDMQSVLTAVTCRLLGPGRTVPIVIDDCKSVFSKFNIHEWLVHFVYVVAVAVAEDIVQ